MVFAMPNLSNPCKPQHRSTSRAFTLVELLVVIGIIALLISILLPSLAIARQAAQRAACAAKLHAIMVAANVHAADHQGYFPIVGQLNGTGGQCTPAGLDDSYTAKYTWVGDSSLTANNGDFRLLAPITLALGAEMGFKANLNLSIADALVANGLGRNFQCPSQVTSDADFAQAQQTGWLYAGFFGGYYGGFTDQISYVFNEGALGFDDTYGRLRGKVSRIRQPARTMFASDGLGGSTKTRLSGTWASFNAPNAPGQPWPSYTIWNFQSYAPVTLSDAITHRTSSTTGKIIAGDVANFDQVRHRGKMNIAFCDGHVELREIPSFTLPTPTSLTPTFKSDPTAVGLMNVYLLAP
jgi:prepilin-type processing-associated H-X9-DG protein/prepilin-type N-terminal cleavage/methylation domain-containing protein